MNQIRSKWLSKFAVLAVLAVLTPITGNEYWMSFLGFLSFLAFTRIRSDERYQLNIDRAARNGFIASLLCIVGLVLCIASNPAQDTLVYAIEITLVLVSLTFSASYTYYDKKGV